LSCALKSEGVVYLSGLSALEQGLERLTLSVGELKLFHMAEYKVRGREVLTERALELSTTWVSATPPQALTKALRPHTTLMRGLVRVLRGVMRSSAELGAKSEREQSTQGEGALTERLRGLM
jgi:hypothetical protein